MRSPQERVSFRTWADSSKRRRIRLFVLNRDLMGEFRSCDNTIANALFALATRVYVTRTPWNPGPLYNKVLNRAAGILGRQLRAPLEHEEVLEVFSGYTARKREMYTECLDVPLSLPVHSKITAFVKDEFVEVVPGKVFKPRMIQFRDPVFLAHCTRLYKPLEWAFCHGRFLFNSHQEITCAKGMNLDRRMEAILDCVRALDNPYVVDLDGSAFDAHVCRDALKSEWRFYLKAARAAGWGSDDLRALRQFGLWQEINRCKFRGKDGTASYTVEGNRMSGDINTGCGNTVLMSLMIATLCKRLGIPDTEWRMLVDGDDSLLFVTGRWADRVKQSVRSTFEDFSHDVKAGDPLPVSERDLERVDFCQCRPVRVDGVWRLVRKPARAINVYSRNGRWYQTQDLACRYWRSITDGELPLTAGVPVMQAFYSRLAAEALGFEPLPSVLADRYSQRNNVDKTKPRWSDVSESTRLSFWKAFDIAPVRQRVLEEAYLGLKKEDVWNGF